MNIECSIATRQTNVRNTRTKFLRVALVSHKLTDQDKGVLF